MMDKILNAVLDIRQEMTTFVKSERFESRMDDMLTTMDRFAKLHETLDQELVALRGKYDRLEERLMAVELKLGLVA